jgi:hypothetical protein
MNGTSHPLHMRSTFSRLNEEVGVRMKTILVVLLQSLILTIFFTAMAETYTPHRVAPVIHLSRD